MYQKLLVFFIFSLHFSRPVYSQTAVFDMREWNGHDIVSLSGTWEFYWQGLLTPEQIATGELGSSSKELVEVPHSWNKSPGYPEKGYATYRSRVLLPDLKEAVILEFQPISSAARIYVNGKLFREVGSVHESFDERYYRPQQERLRYIVNDQIRELEIVIQVASFEFYLAGIGSEPRLASLEALQAKRESSLILSIFLLGCTLIMGVYHLALYALRTREKSTLYFAILCLSVAVYVFADYSLQTYRILIPDASYEMGSLLFHGWVAGLGASLLFTYELFSRIYSKRFAYSLAGASFLYLAYVLIDGNPRSYISTAIIPQLIALAYSSYTFYILIKALRWSYPGVILFGVGAGLFIVSSIHDILLAAGLFRSVPLGPFGMLAFILSQSFLLAHKFSSAFNKVETSEKEIRALSDQLKVEHAQVIELNTNLEAIVEEKTRDIRSIMTHIELGIFAIYGENYSIHKDYSAHLCEIFERDNLDGENSLEILFENSNLSSDERAQIQTCFDMSLEEDIMNYHTNSHCLPAEIKRQRKDSSMGIYELTWNPVANDEDVVEKILVSIREVTELRALQEEAQEKQEELSFIGELLGVSAETFRRFIQNSHAFIDENRRLINSKSIEAKDLETLKVLFINMHTMKGAARSLYLKKMTRILHDVEQYYALLQKEPKASWDAMKMNEDLNEVELTLGVYEKISREKLGRNTGDQRKIEVEEADLVNIYELFVDASFLTKKSLANQISKKIFDEIYVSAESVFTDVCSLLPTLAKDLGKEPPELELFHSDLYLSSKGEELVHKIFVHLLRNSMDHGIEPPEVRVSHKKNPQGKISIHLDRQPDLVRLRYFDDGAGLNLDRIVEIAARQGVEVEGLSLVEKAELIFHSGLSTASELSDVSGRGVGMDAIKSYLKRQGGSISIRLGEKNTLSRFDFMFELTLPLQLFVLENAA